MFFKFLAYAFLLSSVSSLNQASFYAKYSWNNVAKSWDDLCPDINGTVLLLPGMEMRVGVCVQGKTNCTISLSCRKDHETRELSSQLSWSGNNCVKKINHIGPSVNNSCSVAIPDKPHFGKCCF